MYIEVSTPVRQGDFATLSTPAGLFDVSRGSTFDLVFWYHMYGSSTGTLNVTAVGGNGGSTVLFSRSGEGQYTTSLQRKVLKESLVGILLADNCYTSSCQLFFFCCFFFFFLFVCYVCFSWGSRPGHQWIKYRYFYPGRLVRPFNSDTAYNKY